MEFSLFMLITWLLACTADSVLGEVLLQMNSYPTSFWGKFNSSRSANSEADLPTGIAGAFSQSLTKTMCLGVVWMPLFSVSTVQKEALTWLRNDLIWRFFVWQPKRTWEADSRTQLACTSYRQRGSKAIVCLINCMCPPRDGKKEGSQDLD